MNMENNIQMVPIEEIIPNRFQPRLTFNEEGLNELSDSIKQHGIIQPIVVRKLGDKFEIIAGERRYKAATQAGLTEVPVVISNIDDNKSAEVALVENIQRRNLTSIEEAKSYKNLLDRGYLTQEQLAKKMGVSQSTIANKLRLLNLDAEVQDALLNERISERHARALLTLDTKEEQREWLNRIISERMTVRQLDTELKKYKNPDAEDSEASIPLVNINPDLDNIINNAEDINVVRKPHDIESMLTPDATLEITKESKNEEIIPPKDPIKPQQQNKFFNFLEDEEANMDMGDDNEIFSLFNNPNIDITEPLKEPENQAVEEFITENNQEKLNPTTTDIIEDEKNPIIEGDKNTNILTDIVQDQLKEPSNVETLDDLEESKDNIPDELNPFDADFFPNLEPQKEEVKEFPSPETFESTLEAEELIKEEPKKSEEIVDPVDSIVTLAPDYQEKQEEKAGLDLKTAISTVRETVDDLNKKGFYAEIEEADLSGIYQITIKIDK